MTDALEEEGCLVVTDLLDADDRAAVRAELTPYMEAARVIENDDPTQFYPGRTRRTSALIANSETAGRIAIDTHTLQLCDRFLIPALEVGPGARAQILHREDDSFTFFPEPRPNLILASMWAITDFRPDNGGTLIVPGSHRWPAEREAQADEIVAAAMPAGSVLYWLGSTLHGAGANTADDWRYGVILTYSLGWLRQEENQYLDVPPEVARDLPAPLRDLIGYRMYRALGFSLNREVGVRPD